MRPNRGRRPATRLAATAITIGVALAIPAQASAVTTKQETAAVKKAFTNQIRANLELGGYKYLGDSLKCIFVGEHTWTCYAKYSAKKEGYFFKYGVYITATPYSWKTSGDATLLKEW